MKWFEGSIAEAVTVSKQKNAFFLVFIEGQDEQSASLLSSLDSPQALQELSSNSFVSVKLENGSQSHQQFAEIYKLVPVPSIFFIAKNGAPLEVVVGGSSKEVEVKKILDAIDKCYATEGRKLIRTEAPAEETAPTSTPVAPPAEATPKSTTDSTTPTKAEDISNDLSSEEPSQPPNAAGSSSPLNMEEKIEKARELIEKKKIEKKAEEEQKEKEKELERRRLGQAMTEFRRTQQERELKELLEEREREKQEAAAVKKKILEQIAQDRADKLARSTPVTQAEPPKPQPTPPPPVDANTARIQFKIPNGPPRSHSFPAETTLGQVREYINNNIELPFRDYQMATSYPRREFTPEDELLDLRALQLLPSAVIHLMPLQRTSVVTRGGSWPKAIMDMFWDLIQPLFSLTNYLRSFIWGAPPRDTTGPVRRPSGSSESRPRPYPPAMSRTAVRKRGNVHSLADTDSSNDENNTWNGNSTQQM